MAPQSSWENTVLQLSWWKALSLCQLHFVKQFKAFYQLSGSCLPQGNACERSGQAGTQTAEVIRYLATSPHLPASSQSAGNNCWARKLLTVFGYKLSPLQPQDGRFTSWDKLGISLINARSLGMVLLSQHLPATHFFWLRPTEILLLLGPPFSSVVKHLLILYLAQSVFLLLTSGLTLKQIKPLARSKRSVDWHLGAPFHLLLQGQPPYLHFSTRFCQILQLKFR